MYACFIQRNLRFAKPNGFVGMITIPNWMFLSSFEALRKTALRRRPSTAFVHNGTRRFGSDFGSCSIRLRNHRLPVNSTAAYYGELFDKQGSVRTIEELEALRSIGDCIIASPMTIFSMIPGSPIAYWASATCRMHFAGLPSLADCRASRKGWRPETTTGFLRLWHEVVRCNRVGFDAVARRGEIKRLKWFPYNKGGEFRKWYGNNRATS